MNSKMKKMMMVCAMCCIGFMSASAQNKFGYIDFQELLVDMPEYKGANTEMEGFGKQLQDELRKMSTELERKYEEYQKGQAKMADAIRELKEKELRDMQARIQEFQESAQENVRKREQELLKPIIEKAKKAIADVAKESGYAYIFDSSPGTPLLYKPEGDNVANLVKKKLASAAPVTTPAVSPPAPAKK